jgi:hypothetical protein
LLKELKYLKQFTRLKYSGGDSNPDFPRFLERWNLGACAPCGASNKLFKELLVPRTGFEPAHLAALPPEDSASTNFAIWAFQFLRKIMDFGCSHNPTLENETIQNPYSGRKILGLQI